MAESVVYIRWIPLPGNYTRRREIGPHVWTPGSLAEPDMPKTLWDQLVAGGILVSAGVGGEAFTEVPKAEADTERAAVAEQIALEEALRPVDPVPDVVPVVIDADGGSEIPMALNLSQVGGDLTPAQVKALQQSVNDDPVVAATLDDALAQIRSRGALTTPGVGADMVQADPTTSAPPATEIPSDTTTDSGESGGKRASRAKTKE